MEYKGGVTMAKRSNRFSGSLFLNEFPRNNPGAVFPKKSRAVVRRRRIFYGVIIIAAVLNLFCFFLLPSLLKKIAAEKLSLKINRDVTIDSVSVNPYALSAAIDGLYIHEPGSSDVFFYCKSIFLDIRISSLFRRAPVVNEVKIERPYINISREKESLYNFSDLLPEGSAGENPGRFLVGNINIENGRIFFKDKLKDKKHLVRNINISLPFISNLPAFINTYTAPSFSAEVNGTPFVLEGKTKPFSDSLETYFDISIVKLALHEYADYSPVPLNFRLISAYMGGDIRISYLQPAEGNSSLTVKGSLGFYGIDIAGDGKTSLAKIDKVDIAIDSVELFARHAVISSISIESPEVKLVRKDGGKMNASSLFSPVSRKREKTGAEEPAAPFIFDIKSVNLSGGSVSFADMYAGAPFDTEFKPVELAISGLSNRKDALARVECSAESEAGETLIIEADAGINPFFSRGKFELGNVVLKKYSPYYGDRVSFDIISGQGVLRGTYRYSGENREFSFSGVNISLRDLRANSAEGETFFVAPSLNIAGAGVDITGRKVNISRFSGEKISFSATRMKDGTLDFLPLVAPSAEAKPAAEKDGSGRSWAFSAGSVEVEGSSLRIKDVTPSDPAYISAENLRAKVSGLLFGSGTKSPFECDFMLNGSGRVSAEGYFIQKPFSAIFRLEAGNLPVMPVQPYLAERLNIMVTGGSLSSEGMLAVNAPEGEKAKVSYRGDVSIDGFHSMDGEYGDPFVSWENLSFKEMGIGVNPSVTEVEEVSLKGLYAGMIVRPDGKINLLNAVKENSGVSSGGEKSGPAEKNEGARGRTRIGRIIVRDSRASFFDRSIEPNYSVSFETLDGSVKGLSSTEEKPAEFNLAATIDGNTPLAINGSIQPLGKELFLDMKVSLDGLDLASASPYSGKYIGYTMRRGRLVLDLDYLIEKRKLRSRNIFMFDQFTLGDKVDSPSATKLPVRFAIALLKDASGRIRIDLPVSGSLDDPKFRIGPIIVKMFVNLIAKAAVSPFSLLGSIFGGGEELSYIEFDYASAVVSPEEQKKLDTLVKILKERPALNLEIEGRTDREKDSEVLRNIMFIKKVKMEKLREMLRKGEDGVSIEDVEVTQEEYGRYLWLAYKGEKFSRPVNILGFVKELPVEEMERLMLEHTEVTDNDLRLLAIARAEAARSYMLKSGVAADRIFLLEPGVLQPDKEDEGVAESRVDFRLK